MSTSKLDTSGVFQPAKVQTSRTELTLPAATVRIRANGIEFLSARPLPAWAEMTVTVVSPADGAKVRATGVVVECRGDRHSGYSVSMLFTNLPRQSQARLSQMAHSL